MSLVAGNLPVTDTTVTHLKDSGVSAFSINPATFTVTPAVSTGTGCVIRVTSIDGGGGVTGIAVSVPGSGYPVSLLAINASLVLTLTGGGNNATVNVTTDSNGTVTAATINAAGTGYTAGPTNYNTTVNAASHRFCTLDFSLGNVAYIDCTAGNFTVTIASIVNMPTKRMVWMAVDTGAFNLRGFAFPVGTVRYPVIDVFSDATQGLGQSGDQLNSVPANHFCFGHGTTMTPFWSDGTKLFATQFSGFIQTIWGPHANIGTIQCYDYAGSGPGVLNMFNGGKIGMYSGSYLWYGDSSLRRASAGLLQIDDGAGNNPRILGGRVMSSAGVAVHDSSSEAVSASFSVAASLINAGTIIKIKGRGTATATVGADTLQFKLRFGTTTLTGTALITGTATDVANADQFTFEFTLYGTAAAAASAAMLGQGQYTEPAGTTFKLATLASTNFATNGAMLIEATLKWNTANANSALVDWMTVEITG